MKTLLVDNYDSFTLNLFHDMAAAFGQAPLLVRNDEVLSEELLQGVGAIVLSPGPGSPAVAGDFGICHELLSQHRIPLLGVCLGHQGLCLHHGARIVRAPEPMHGRLSPITHDGQALFAGLPSPMSVVRYHSLLAVDIPEALEVTARTADGLVMAVAHRELPHFGVQFHPESIATAQGRALMRNFAAIAVRHQPSAPRRPGGATATPSPSNAGTDGVSKPRQTLHVHHRVVPCGADAADLFEHLHGQEQTAFLLDSSLHEGEHAGRYSVMGDASGPRAKTLRAWAAPARVRLEAEGTAAEAEGSIFDCLRSELHGVQLEHAVPGLPFQGGWVGYLGYELKAQCGAAAAHAAREPDACLIFADRAVVLDHARQQAHILCLSPVVQDPDAVTHLQTMSTRIAACPPRKEAPPLPSLSARLDVPRATYLERIRRCQEAIAAGETYEVCLTQRIRGSGTLEPMAAYRRLRNHSPAPYGSFLRLPEVAVLSASPESFLQISPAGRLSSKPIKGTRPRAGDPGRDQALARELAQHEKDRSENLMIVDLTRHDLGRSAVLGSVHVPRLFAVESYAHVHQLVSTVHAQLRPDLHAVDAVRAAFPGGSMTGAPKLRTMAIIDTLEDDARGIYSGALGFFSLCGRVDLAMVIRTLLLREDTFELGTGGAIVSLSEPEAEFEEIVLKARSVLDGLGITLDVDV